MIGAAHTFSPSHTPRLSYTMTHPSSLPPIRFTVSAPNPDDHLFHVSMAIALGEDAAATPHLDLSMPAWSPGSYLLREYARHIQNIRAVDQHQRPLPLLQRDKATWRVLLEDPDVSLVTVQYEVFSHELAVRTNHLDATHGSLNGVSTFLYPHGQLDRASEITFDVPESWRVATGLTCLDASARRYGAQHFDLLFDSPVELGEHVSLHFEVRGIPHEIALWNGQYANFDADRITQDVSRIVEAHAELFGGLPYDHYTFIVHLTDHGFGGLEHHNSTLLLYPMLGFRDGPPGSEFDAHGKPSKSYLNFLRLVSHEFFHTWNVKRIRPEVLGPFDYQQENYTRDLWTVEGVTSYYENVGLLRSNLIDGAHFLELTAQAIHALEQTPGRLLHDLETSSLNAWVKLYRPDEHTRNSSVSYYLKGELVCFALDLFLRARTQNQRSLDDVLERLWQHYQETGEGYAEGSYASWIERATGVDVAPLVQSLVRSTEEIDWDTLLAACGLQLKRGYNEKDLEAGILRTSWTGAQLVIKEHETLTVTFVPTGSPAHEAGIYAGDELIAIDGWRVKSQARFDQILRRIEAGSQVSVTLSRRGRILERTLTTCPPPPNHYSIEVVEQPDEAQSTILSEWLSLQGQPTP